MLDQAEHAAKNDNDTDALASLEARTAPILADADTFELVPTSALEFAPIGTHRTEAERQLAHGRTMRRSRNSAILRYCE